MVIESTLEGQGSPLLHLVKIFLSASKRIWLYSEIKRFCKYLCIYLRGWPRLLQRILITMVALRCCDVAVQILLALFLVGYAIAKSAIGDRVLVIHEDLVQTEFSQFFDSLKSFFSCLITRILIF